MGLGKRAKGRYFIEDGDLGIAYRDHGPWRSYNIADCNSNDLGEAIENLSILEIDQDGGELACYGFWDATNDVQHRIIRLLGASMYDVLQEGEKSGLF